MERDRGLMNRIAAALRSLGWVGPSTTPGHLGCRPLGLVAIGLLSSSLWGCEDSRTGGLDRRTDEVIAQKIRRVEIPGEKTPIEMEGWEVHHLDFDLDADEFLHFAVEQHGVDVVVRLFVLDEPDREPLVEVDSPTGTLGVEELVAVIPEKNRYRFEIAAPAKQVKPGHYLFTIQARRKATENDREWVTADRSYHRGRRQLKNREYRLAIESLSSTLDTWQRLALPRREAETRDHLYRCHKALDELYPALAECERALAWYRVLGDSRLAGSLLNAATIQISLGHPDAALERLREALPLFEERDFQRGVALALSRLGLAYLKKGRLQRSLSYYEEALAKARSIGRTTLEGSILVDSGTALLSLHRSQDALERYSQAVELYRQLEDPPNMAMALNGLARAGEQLGELDEAEELLRQALVTLGKAHPRSRAAVLHTLGNVRRQRQDPEQAREYFEQALELVRQAGDLQSEAQILLSLGYLLVESGDPQSGLELHDRAQELYETSGNGAGVASARVRGGEALRDLGRLQEAWRRLAPALGTIEVLRATTERSDLRISYFGFRQEYFEIAHDLLMRWHEVDPQSGHDREAFRLHEHRLARELLDSLALEHTMRDQADPALLEKERVLEQQLREQVGKELSQARQRLIGELIAELHRVRSEIEADEVPPPELVELEQVQSTLLDPDTLLLVYALGEQRSFLWAVSTQERTTEILPGREEIEALTRSFIRRMAGIRQREQRARAEIGKRLSDMLLGPVAPRLAGQRLVIVGGGELQQIPFAALPTPGAPADQFLIREHEIVTLPSVSVLAALRRRAGHAAKQARIATFADPVFSTKDPRVREGSDEALTDLQATPDDLELKRAEIEIASKDLKADPTARLPGTRREAEAILEMAWGAGHLLAVGFEASRETFLDTSWESYQILHLATHALLHPQPELSALVLAQVSQDGRRLDGLLPAVEIARLDLPLELVVLSACQTGVGQAVRGEGVLGLARAFLNAGSRRVVASLWKVSDRRTSDLMIAFYDGHLNRRLAPATALRQAQLSMLERPGSSPWDWAGFVLQGDWR